MCLQAVTLSSLPANTLEFIVFKGFVLWIIHWIELLLNSFLIRIFRVALLFICQCSLSLLLMYLSDMCYTITSFDTCQQQIVDFLKKFFKTIKCRFLAIYCPFNSIFLSFYFELCVTFIQFFKMLSAIFFIVQNLIHYFWKHPGNSDRIQTFTSMI